VEFNLQDFDNGVSNTTNAKFEVIGFFNYVPKGKKSSANSRFDIVEFSGITVSHHNST
jgi:hypothetical protein